MKITVERNKEKMTIAALALVEKGKKYFVDGVKTSKATAEIMVQSYVQMAIADGATIEIDTRLADEFKAITSSPYKGEFAIIYTDKDGKPVEVAAEKQGMYADSVDTTPYHVEIKMYGNKTPIFEIVRDGRNIFSKRGDYTFRKSEVDEWIIKAYQMRKQYPNMTIELPEVVAALYLDSLACNPRIARDLNVTLTSFEMEGEPIIESNERQINEYAIIYGSTTAAIDAATQAEIELANNANNELDENNVDDADNGEDKITVELNAKMTITTKEGANGRISGYYLNGVKVRKAEVEYHACNPAYDGIIVVDYFTARHQFPNLYLYGSAVVFKNWVDGSDVMTKPAADRLGLKLGKKISLNPAIYRVVKNEVPDVEPNPVDYAITAAAQDVASDAEIQLANNDKQDISDSLIRAMKINLEKVQAHCRDKNISAARVELELFGICRAALFAPKDLTAAERRAYDSQAKSNEIYIERKVIRINREHSEVISQARSLKYELEQLATQTDILKGGIEIVKGNRKKKMAEYDAKIYTLKAKAVGCYHQLRNLKDENPGHFDYKTVDGYRVEIEDFKVFSTNRQAELQWAIDRLKCGAELSGELQSCFVVSAHKLTEDGRKTDCLATSSIDFNRAEKARDIYREFGYDAHISFFDEYEATYTLTYYMPEDDGSNDDSDEDELQDPPELTAQEKISAEIDSANNVNNELDENHVDDADCVNVHSSDDNSTTEKTTAKFEAGKVYFVPWTEDTGRPHISKFTIQKRTAKTVIINGQRAKIRVWADSEVAKVSYCTYVYAKDLFTEDTIKAQAEKDAAWDRMEKDIKRRIAELKTAAVKSFESDADNNDFNAKLAKLQAKVDAAKAIRDAKLNTLNKAQKEFNDANDAVSKAQNEIRQLFIDKAMEIQNSLLNGYEHIKICLDDCSHNFVIYEIQGNDAPKELASCATLEQVTATVKELMT